MTSGSINDFSDRPPAAGGPPPMTALDPLGHNVLSAPDPELGAAWPGALPGDAPNSQPVGREGRELLRVLYEDGELLVLNKPADLVCHPTKTDEWSSLIGRLRLHLGGPAHLINRLDRETSGVVVAAKQAQTAGQLGKIWESRAVQKVYLAIVHGHPAAELGVIEAPLAKDVHSAVVIKDCVRADGAAAVTGFRVERRFVRAEGQFALLRVTPRTGRKHQIRIHLAHLGHPIVGDKLYGGDEGIYLDLVMGRLTAEQRRRLLVPCQALHAAALSFPWEGSQRVFLAQPEPWFAQFCGAG